MPDFLSGEILARFVGVLAIDLILSGDNAVVIALAVRQLEGSTRKKAIFWGALGAVGLRLIFAAIITYLLLIPLLQAVAALLLIWIAWKLLFDSPGGEGGEDEEGVKAGGSIWEAIRIIIIADVVMSLDNVVALVGVSGGNLWLLVFGLLLTIPLIVWGSTILSALMDRFSWLVYVGAGILIYVAVEMFLKDRTIEDYLGDAVHGIEWVIGLSLTALFLLVAYLYSRRGASTGEPG